MHRRRDGVHTEYEGGSASRLSPFRRVGGPQACARRFVLRPAPTPAGLRGGHGRADCTRRRPCCRCSSGLRHRASSAVSSGPPHQSTRRAPYSFGHSRSLADQKIHLRWFRTVTPALLLRSRVLALNGVRRLVSQRHGRYWRRFPLGDRFDRQDFARIPTRDH